MSATVAAALKKIAIAILTDKKLLKIFLGIFLGFILLIMFPFIAIIALFNGEIQIDTARLQSLVVENLSAEERAMLQLVENTMYEIEDKMTALTNNESRRHRCYMYLHFPDFLRKPVLRTSWSGALRKASRTWSFCLL